MKIVTEVAGDARWASCRNKRLDCDSKSDIDDLDKKSAPCQGPFTAGHRSGGIRSAGIGRRSPGAVVFVLA
ncbi:MAG: hypothetical protein PVF59_08350, partial [Desulfobacterales bacterium]